MAKISTYPLDTNLVGSDYWIGSDANSNYATKNFTIDSVAEYMNREATQSQLLRFKYVNTIPLTIGSLSFDPVDSGPATKDYSTITTFRLSKNDLTESSVDISSFYTSPLAGADVLITQCDDISRWGRFTWNTSTPVGVAPVNYYDIGLTFLSGSNGLIANKDYFISLLTYPGQNDAYKVMALDGSTDEYILNHNLGKFCSVTVVDANDDEVFTNIRWNSVNQVTLNFSINFTGQAFFN